MMEIRIDEVLKIPENIRPGDSVAVSIANGGGQGLELIYRGYERASGVWLLAITPGKKDGDRAYYYVSIASRERVADWPAVLQQFRDAVSVASLRAKVTISMSVPTASTIAGVPISVGITMKNTGDVPVTLPAFGGVLLNAGKQQNGIGVWTVGGELYSGDMEIDSMAGLPYWKTLGNARFPQGGKDLVLQPGSEVRGTVLARLVCRDDWKGGAVPFCARVIDSRGVALLRSASQEIRVQEYTFTDDDKRAADELTKTKSWWLLGPTSHAVREKDEAYLLDMVARYGGTVYGPSLRCGLAFLLLKELQTSPEFTGIPEIADQCLTGE